MDVTFLLDIEAFVVRIVDQGWSGFTPTHGLRHLMLATCGVIVRSKCGTCRSPLVLEAHIGSNGALLRDRIVIKRQSWVHLASQG